MWSNFANRTIPETEESVGWFGNAHILGIDLSEDPQIDKLIKKTGRVIVDADAHQEIPLPLLWSVFLREHLELDPFSEAYVSIDFLVRETSNLNCGLVIQPYRVWRKTAEEALRVTIVEEDGNVSILCEYSAERFLRSGIRAMLTAMSRVLETMADSPESHVSEFYRLIKDIGENEHDMVLPDHHAIIDRVM
jgi:non-ribosomal peptide synthetase component F